MPAKSNLNVKDFRVRYLLKIGECELDFEISL